MQHTRPLPFLLRVALEWTSPAEASHVDDGAIFFCRSAALSEVGVTLAGGDTEFGDLEVGL